jgi:hypothetical protein
MNSNRRLIFAGLARLAASITFYRTGPISVTFGYGHFALPKHKEE